MNTTISATTSGRGKKRAEQPPRRHAGGIHDDDLGIGRKLVEHVGDRDHQRDRRDHQDELRDHQPGDADEHQDRLALAGHQVDIAQRLGDPDDRRQADEDQQERAERMAKYVAVDRPHRPLLPRAPASTAGNPNPQNHATGRNSPLNPRPSARFTISIQNGRLEAKLLKNKQEWLRGYDCPRRPTPDIGAARASKFASI